VKPNEKLDLDPHEIDRRKRFVQFDERDVKGLRALLPVVKKHVDAVISAFYDHVSSFPELNNLLSDETTLTRLKQAQRAYLLELFEGDYGPAYFEKRSRVGEVHERIGLAPKWYVGSYSCLLGLLFSVIVKTYRFRPQKARQALLSLVRLTNLDKQATVDTYIGSKLKKLQHVGEDIRETSQMLSSTTAEISVVVEQHERTASQQSASVNETTVTMEQLARSSRQSSEQAKQAANGAKQVFDLAKDGNVIVRETLEGIDTLKGKVGGIAEQILQLSEHISQIGEITYLVSDLANQTNLLSLNAAVEAARAGEHGKGFAVVASEIRKLADESKKSAARIATLIADVQQTTNATVMATEEGMKTVEQGAQLAQKTARAFDQVSESINRSFEGVEQIALNEQQQTAAIHQVLEAMKAIDAGAKETATGIRQTKESIDTMKQAAHKLTVVAEAA